MLLGPCAAPCLGLTHLLKQRNKWHHKYARAIAARLPASYENLQARHLSHVASNTLDAFTYGLGISQVLTTILWLQFSVDGMTIRDG
jgi:hypothetical protein